MVYDGFGIFLKILLITFDKYGKLSKENVYKVFTEEVITGDMLMAALKLRFKKVFEKAMSVTEKIAARVVLNVKYQQQLVPNRGKNERVFIGKSQND